MRGNNSFAYDLVVKPGGVNSRVALLLRSIEPKPVVFEGFPTRVPLARFSRDQEGKQDFDGFGDI